jgi:hypothetical protein
MRKITSAVPCFLRPLLILVCLVNAFTHACIASTGIGMHIIPGPVVKSYPGSDGTPYFPETYKYATITLVQGRALRNVKARVDLVENETQFISANGAEGLLNRGMVREVSYADTVDAIITQYKLRTGFPPIEKFTKDNFYLVLADGRCSFLKAIIKKVTEIRNELPGGMVKSYETLEDYYIYAKGEIRRWKRDKDFILAELADKKSEVDQFVLANKTNFRNAESVAKLVSYYNSL